MGIQLDWQVESGRVQQKPHQEDPDARRGRWRAFIRLMTVLGVFVGLIALSIWLVTQRLEQADQRAEQLLKDTVSAEVATLRIGDYGAFMRLQESATDAWRITQTEVYQTIQARKQTNALTLTGRIVDVEISSRRGRVQVEEIENGVPYVQTWFYWRYDEDASDPNNIKPAGWYHVPPDYTFWGEASQIQKERFTVRYAFLDAPFADAISMKLDTWFLDACSFLDCARLPYLTLDIVSNPQQPIEWLSETNGQVVLPSPYTKRARLDVPFDVSQQIALGTLLAQNWVKRLLPSVVYASDAEYFQTAVTTWLVGRWAQVDAQSYLIDSMARTYGVEVLPSLLNALQPDSEIDVLVSVLGISDLASLPLDWRDFLRWRLQIEADTVLRRDEGAFVRLYDTRSETLRLRAYERFNALIAQPDVQIISLTPQVALDGTPQLLAVVTIQQGGVIWDEAIVFQWVNNVLRRAS